MPGKPTLVLIPGIGGHPRFHQGFVGLLAADFLVHSAPHVDFSGPPCAEWERHVAHWLGEFERAANGRPAALVGVSYGAHLAVELLRRLPAGAVRAVVLVSYWPLSRWQRHGLRRLRGLRRAGPAVLGRASFRWSERQSVDVAGLRRLRRELYDDERAAWRRLFARLTSLADAPPAPGPGVARYVYGRAEVARRRRPPGAELVAGDHSVSLDGSAELAAVVGRLIGEAGS